MDRLIAKGYRQYEIIDYFDSYTPIARRSSIKVHTSLASIYNTANQIDAKTISSNGDLDEVSHME